MKQEARQSRTHEDVASFHNRIEFLSSQIELSFWYFLAIKAVFLFLQTEVQS